MAIFAFGDSHTHYIFSRCSNVTTFWLGPRTMHRVGRDGASFIPHLAAPGPDDALILVFGEIDVRCHIARVAGLGNRTIEYTIGDLVARYVRQTRLTIDHFGIRSRVFMLGVPPPLDPLVPNPRLPVNGTLRQRIDIRRMLNAVLEPHAKAFDIAYVPIPSLYENPDGSLRMRLSDGHHHIAMDRAHHVCRAVGTRIGEPLHFVHPSPIERMYLRALRAGAIRRGDAGALWHLGRLEYRRRDRSAAFEERAMGRAGSEPAGAG